MKKSNLRAIIYHLDNGEDNGGISREALSLFLKSLLDNPDYGYLDALNDLEDVQFIQNTWQEAEIAKKEVEKIIKELCGVST